MGSGSGCVRGVANASEGGRDHKRTSATSPPSWRGEQHSDSALYRMESNHERCSSAARVDGCSATEPPPRSLCFRKYKSTNPQPSR